MAHRHPGDLTLVATGPLTNLALALRKDPTMAPLISEIILMGGSTTGGNATPAAEWNIYNDPEAARIVFESRIPITMVGINAAMQTLLTRDDVARLAVSDSCIGKFAAQLGDFYLKGGEAFGRSTGSPLYDPLAVAIAIDKTLATTTLAMHIDVETKGEFTYGETVFNSRLTRSVTELQGDHRVFVRREPVAANADVPTVIAAERFMDLLIKRLTATHDRC
jgi:inosine-uridine nucleoside N-ribohydrolase